MFGDTGTRYVSKQKYNFTCSFYRKFKNEIVKETPDFTLDDIVISTDIFEDLLLPSDEANKNKLEHQKIEHDISNKLAKKEAINQFIKTIKKQDKIITEFNKVLWGTLLESATIKDKNTIIFKFKDGTEING